MLGNKSFAASGYEIINLAYQHAKNNRRNIGTIDILMGIASEQNNVGGRILREIGVSEHSINGTYPNIIVGHGQEDFKLESFCNFANLIAEGAGDNAISAEHMLLAIFGLPGSFANVCLNNHNLNIFSLDSLIADAMGRPGFTLSYLFKFTFWYNHFERWVRSNPILTTKNWIPSTEIDKGAYSFYESEGECALVVKESKDCEFMIDASIEAKKKTLTVTASRRHVSLVQACFLSFALGRLAFNKDKS
jgi:hypothetical protein